MRSGRAGTSLIEVLVACLVLAIGLLPLGYGLASGSRAARRGEARVRLALALSARVGWAAEVAAGTSPRCRDLMAGADRSGLVEEWWQVADSAGFRVVTAHARARLPGGPVADSVTVRIRCQ
jgi:Tfp pilus assembly protein PilV